MKILEYIIEIGLLIFGVIIIALTLQWMTHANAVYYLATGLIIILYAIHALREKI